MFRRMDMHTGPQQLLHEIHFLFASDRWLVIGAQFMQPILTRTTINWSFALLLFIFINAACSRFKLIYSSTLLGFIIRMEIFSYCCVVSVFFIHCYDAIAICCRYIDLLQKISIDLTYCCYIFFFIFGSLFLFFIFFFISSSFFVVFHLFFHLPCNWFSIIIALNGRFLLYTKY